MKELSISEFINRILKVIHQPELHMREIPILIGIAILLMFIMLVLIAVIFVRPGGNQSKPTDQKQTIRSVRKRFIVLLAAGAFMIISSGIFMIYSSKPQFCAGCHEMRPAYNLSPKTSHKNIGCLSCHQEPGLTGIFIEKWQLAEMLTAKIGMAGDVMSGRVADESCLRCHEDITKAVKTVGSIRIKHKEPVQAGYKCTDCHFSKKTFHAAKRKLDKFGMSRCVDCHNQKKASAECGVCHIQGNSVTKNVNRTDYPMVNLPDTVFCNNCHSKKLCLKCHTSQMPHDGEWKSAGHAMDAFISKDVCWQCHRQFDCRKCHTRTSPHIEGWVKNHGLASKSSPSSCSSCHEMEVFCLTCHNNTVLFQLEVRNQETTTSPWQN